MNSVNTSNSSKDGSNKNWRHRVNQCIEHGINKQIHFKHRDKDKSQVLSEKKLTILREPILKSIGRSAYHNGNQNKSCCEPKSSIEHSNSTKKSNDLSNASNSTAWFAHKTQCGDGGGVEDQDANGQLKANCTITKCGRATELCITKLVGECQQVAGTSADANNVMIHRIQNWQLNDDSTVDFKSLVNECDNLTLSAPNENINSITELHKTKNFQILQANQIGGNIGVNAASPTDATNNNNLPNNSVHAALTATTATTVTAPTGTGTNTNAMNSSLSSNSSNSSSCSQQARMNSSNCDVTIDELASYIEFQLHLPKPMSSNVYEAMFS